MPWQEVVFDLGCHGYTHTSAAELTKSDYEHEVKEAIEYLRATFPDQEVLTFAASFNTVNLTYLAYLDDYAISCRIGTNGEQAYLGEDFDKYIVKAFGFNEDTNFTTLHAQTDELVNNGAWVVYFFHTVTSGEPYEEVGTSKAVLDAHCKALYEKYNGNVWFGSFQEVSMYAYQLENVKITPTILVCESMVLNVNTTLDTDVYNIPMSIKINIPSSSDSAYALVNGTKQDVEITTEADGNKYICVLDVPVNNSTVEICFD